MQAGCQGEFTEVGLIKVLEPKIYRTFQVEQVGRDAGAEGRREGR